ncbi:MAG: outer membrane lipid asymmetry maintenance protein MlaD [Holosporaceae bacterium]|jgi:phospholipid/cholesterol/gamma-HCH transport system substrate-binding protein|nr:outer membrane lipid asymmetry maintenance protein MlaD [Holosporaceae bacterium]
MEQGRFFETIVGWVVLLTAIFFFNYVYTKSSWRKVDGYILTAKFDKADGLTEGGDVKISGVRVGKIASLDIDSSSFFAVVKFHIPHKIKLPKDSSAQVSTDGIFGGKYLSIVPGGSTEVLNDGEEIENTSGTVNLESLIGSLVLPQDKNKNE